MSRRSSSKGGARCRRESSTTGRSGQESAAERLPLRAGGSFERRRFAAREGPETEGLLFFWGTRRSRKPGASAGFRDGKVGLGTDFLEWKPGVGAGFSEREAAPGLPGARLPTRLRKVESLPRPCGPTGRVVQRSSLSVRVRCRVGRRSPLSRLRERGRG
jgi:hypothetical protein